MKTVKKEIRLGELLPTMILVQKLLGVGDGMDEIKNEKGRQEVLRLMSLGILKGVDPKNPFGKTPEELEKVKMSGLANHEYDIKVLVDKIGVEGYSPDKHTHIKVYKGNNIIYGTPIFQALKKLYGEDYMVEVMEVIED
jgi:hypothetical protein|tara:strand:+ start:1333 stop:1749 length:417 start_codon:yes stop_codon:yes gene_type:complete